MDRPLTKQLFDPRVIHETKLLTSMPSTEIHRINVNKADGIDYNDPAYKTALASCRTNLVKQRLSNRQLAHSLSIKLIPDPEMAVMAADAGYHSLLIDLEHSSINLSTASAISCACLQAGYVVRSYLRSIEFY